MGGGGLGHEGRGWGVGVWYLRLIDFCITQLGVGGLGFGGRGWGFEREDFEVGSYSRLIDFGCGDCRTWHFCPTGESLIHS